MHIASLISSMIKFRMLCKWYLFHAKMDNEVITIDLLNANVKHDTLRIANPDYPMTKSPLALMKLQDDVMSISQTGTKALADWNDWMTQPALK